MEKTLRLIQELTKKDPKTIIERTLKGAEEFGELAEAVLSFKKVSACAYKELGKDEIVEEGVDVLLVVLAVIFQADPEISLEDLDKIMQKKSLKWEQKINK
ncbi:MAG: hypothetical protein K9M44_01815 [Candidatus Pacebacteria bacterium]|nr:hypothetical protein [Candidatus Paceibacterota bacterium]